MTMKTDDIKTVVLYLLLLGAAIGLIKSTSDNQQLRAENSELKLLLGYTDQEGR